MNSSGEKDVCSADLRLRLAMWNPWPVGLSAWILRVAEPLTVDTKFFVIVFDWLYPPLPSSATGANSLSTDADTTSILCDVDEPLIEKYNLSVSLNLFFLTL